jgi:hypothetical protein
MIHTDIVLYWGKLTGCKFKYYDSVNFELNLEDSEDDPCVDNINDWLNMNASPVCNYAELYVEVSPYGKKYLIGTFKTLKLKSGKVKWILAD